MSYFYNETRPNNSPQSTSLDMVGADGNTLTLQDRALPYRPISINGRQRAEFTWYPGSPNATVQMLGPEEGVISLRGFWKDRFVTANKNATVTTGKNAPVVSDESLTPTSAESSGALLLDSGEGKAFSDVGELVRFVDNWRRQGVLIKLQWDSLIRHGHITSFTQTWHNSHDVEWELEFSVLAHADLTAPTFQPAPSSADVAITAQKLWADFAAAVDGFGTAIATSQFGTDAAAVVRSAQEWQAVGRQLEADVLKWAININNVAQQAVTVIQTPNEVGRSLLGAFAGATETAIFRAGGSVFDSVITEAFIVGEPFGAVQQDNVPFGLQISERSYLTRLKNAKLAIRTSNAVWRSEYTRELQQDGVRSYVARADEDLRDIATRFYGTPDNWQQLMLYNGLQDSEVRAGFVLLIPPRLDGGPAGRR